MRIERAPVDELALLLTSAQMNVLGLAQYKETKDFAGVKRFFGGTKALIVDIDKQMTQLGLQDQLFAIAWASRMELIIKHFDHLERNLPHAGSRLFDWDQVLTSMGLLLAFRVGAEQTIGLNEHLLTKTPSS